MLTDIVHATVFPEDWTDTQRIINSPVPGWIWSWVGDAA